MAPETSMSSNHTFTAQTNVVVVLVLVVVLTMAVGSFSLVLLGTFLSSSLLWFPPLATGTQLYDEQFNRDHRYAYQDPYCFHSSEKNDSRFQIVSFALAHGKLFVFTPFTFYTVVLETKSSGSPRFGARKESSQKVGPPFSVSFGQQLNLELNSYLAGTLIDSGFVFRRLFTTAAFEVDPTSFVLILAYQPGPTEFHSTTIFHNDSWPHQKPPPYQYEYNCFLQNLTNDETIVLGQRSSSEFREVPEDSKVSDDKDAVKFDEIIDNIDDKPVDVPITENNYRYEYDEDDDGDDNDGDDNENVKVFDDSDNVDEDFGGKDKEFDEDDYDEDVEGDDRDSDSDYIDDHQPQSSTTSSTSTSSTIKVLARGYGPDRTIIVKSVTSRFLSGDGYFIYLKEYLHGTQRQLDIFRYSFAPPNYNLTMVRMMVYKLNGDLYLTTKSLYDEIQAKHGDNVKPGTIDANNGFIHNDQIFVIANGRIEIADIHYPAQDTRELWMIRKTGISIPFRDFLYCKLADRDNYAYNAIRLLAIWYVILFVLLALFLIAIKQMASGHRFILGPNLALLELTDELIYKYKTS